MKEKQVVLILEDDKDLADEISFAVRQAGFEVAVCHSVKMFWQYVAHREVDVMIVDLGLPDGYGINVIREVRSNSDVPIIITSGNSAVEERVAGIEIGADDYLAKPYNSREIIAKISRFLSRSRGSQFSSRISRLAGSAEYIFADFVLDTQAMSLSSPSGEDISITTYEFLVLRSLVERPNTVLSRGSLVDFVYTDNTYGSERTIDNLISRIRAKLSAHTELNLVKTVRGVGYVFTADVESR
ncbi:MAG: response regulator transcription factor [Halioglobus sp.]